MTTRLLRAFEATWFEVLQARELVSLAVISVLFYAFYYPAPYSQQQALALPMVVVDRDRTPLSRAVIRHLGETPAVRIVALVPDMMAAREEVRQRRADGILYLSKGLGGAALKGRPGAGAALIVNGAYFVRAEGIARALGDVVREQALEVTGALTARHSGSGATIVMQPLFNTTGGYRDYVFPAIANIILQQTLLFASARLIAERRRRDDWQRDRATALGTWIAMTLIGIFAGLFVFGFAFWVQDVPRTGNVPGLLLALPVFAATVAALGLVAGSLFRSGDDALKLLMPTSVPLVFLAGFAWPLDEMPGWLATIAWFSPATAAMHLFIRFNQMGASIAEAATPLLVLIGLMIGYGAIWCFGRAHAGREDPTSDAAG
ncbi:multidrug ABC transporter permease [Sphingomonas aquatilis NBRC 16722]|uniref:ABC-2 type transport system permease protein n=1 Tax=Sphingomonas aquatilis TaxID=93063 RepID=A0AAW3TW18_9SPHN|nr:ABC transporter permease [Sphingomonas aquatilis]MBB3877433.1 ABC-2 type transport system permease protein [Sphingomonas aquatilis]GEM73007.1 multidrug ABC transporter permease [Sphingomonas aquatilis NBRC 16722]